MMKFKKRKHSNCAIDIIRTDNFHNDTKGCGDEFSVKYIKFNVILEWQNINFLQTVGDLWLDKYIRK